MKASVIKDEVMDSYSYFSNITVYVDLEGAGFLMEVGEYTLLEEPAFSKDAIRHTRPNSAYQFLGRFDVRPVNWVVRQNIPEVGNLIQPVFYLCRSKNATITTIITLVADEGIKSATAAAKDAAKSVADDVKGNTTKPLPEAPQIRTLDQDSSGSSVAEEKITGDRRRGGEEPQNMNWE
ncbi:MAG: hypothetical protein M1816_001926 [Peltula sp. TS41687]|nr:MAG: hypothetical protein M1816_001926 [Peltula sp. TS41687]